MMRNLNLRTSRVLPLLTLVGVVCSSTACSFVMRDQATYRSDTRQVLEQRQSKVSSCYEEQLERDQTVEGTTVVNFVVEAKTGQFLQAEVDPSSTAPEPLNQCILAALDGLALDPEDQRQGNATFTWRFEAPDDAGTPVADPAGTVDPAAPSDPATRPDPGATEDA